MNIKKALEILKERKLCQKIEKIDGRKRNEKRWLIKCSHSNYEYTDRELISLARIYTNENNQNTAINKNVKLFNNKKNRSATRNKINSEKFDEIPTDKQVKREDRWSWD